MFDYDAVNSSPMMQVIGHQVGGLNNSQLLTIAPTGSISTMLGISGGIEPIFANSYTRKTQSLHSEDVFYKVYTPIVKEYMDAHNLKDESELPSQFVIASDISPRDRINCQAAWQKWIDASISSTINLPNSATVEDVEDIYMYAWERGLKGVTVYRAGCAREGILVTDETKKALEKNENVLERGYIVPAGDNVIGMKRKLMTGCGSLHCSAFFDAETKELRETYLSKGSSGGCNNFMIGLSRMISLSARAGVKLDDIIDQLNSCGVCPSYAVRKATKGDTSPGSCCPIAVGKALKEMHNELLGKTTVNKPINVNAPKCPKCGAEIIHEGGCNICKNCGWTKCE
jgi:ribonucleoside-diphosphate reductase alpha chain